MANAITFKDEEANRSIDMLRCGILDSGYEVMFDNIVFTAAQLFNVPMGAISFIDGDRQWFKAHVGIGLQETERKHAFCARTIDADSPMIIPDATRDPSFARNPFVVGPPGVRFYAGTPLYGPSHSRLGALCVMDTVPRHFNTDNVRLLTMLAAQVSELLCARAAIRTPLVPVPASDAKGDVGRSAA